MRIITLIVFLLLFTHNALALNRFVKETSPYLLQHKDNPLDWYPWGEEAFAKAKRENKLIFLSIGYSTCHWCHVMADESFKNKHIAELINKYFVSIKVDREELPHIDALYQKVYSTMHGKSGGWPLTIMMSSDMEPFFSGTYVPSQEGYGSEGLINIINDVTKTPRKKLSQKGRDVLVALKESQKLASQKISLNSAFENKAVIEFKLLYDFKNGGFSKKPKFPNATTILLLLKLYEVTKNKESLDMALSSLDAMAKGGIYDQIEGGFYRYSVDERWQIPHFEKMLYTNAELIDAYVEAYKHTKNPLYKKVINETIAQMDKRFQNNALFMSASNADSRNFEGKNEEGFYFIYEYDKTVEELKKVLHLTEAKEALEHLGISEEGNFDVGLSNPYITRTKEPQHLYKAKKLLLDMREKREYPFIDNKINSAWNALYIKAKFKASAVDKRYIQEAKNSLEALLKTMYIDNELYHQTITGVKPTQKALLEDYAFLGDALFWAYQTTLEERYFKLYKELVQKSITLFYKDHRWVESNDGFASYADINERAYANALSQNLINIINYSVVEADIKNYNLAKETLESFNTLLNLNPSRYPSASLATLMLKYETVFIKSTQDNLKRFDINDIDYPFVYKYTTDAKEYLGCKINSCFSYDVEFEKVKKDIESLVKGTL